MRALLALLALALLGCPHWRTCPTDPGCPVEAGPADARADAHAIDHPADSLRADTLRPDILRPDTLRPDALRSDTLRRDSLRPTDACFHRCGSSLYCTASQTCYFCSTGIPPYQCGAPGGPCMTITSTCP